MNALATITIISIYCENNARLVDWYIKTIQQ